MVFEHYQDYENCKNFKIWNKLFCGAFSQNIPHRFMYLNAWSPFGGIIWGGFRCFLCWRKYMTREQVTYLKHCHSLFLLCACVSRCDLSDSCFFYHAFFITDSDAFGTISPNKYFLLKTQWFQINNIIMYSQGLKKLRIC